MRDTRAAAPRRVLHLLGTNQFSGAENVIVTMMEQFRGSEVEMVYCSPDGPIREVLTSRGLAFLPLAGLTPHQVRSVLRAHRFDVVHAHDFKASMVAVLAGFAGEIIAHIHSNPRFVKSWNPLSLAFASVARRFHRVVFVSAEATRGTVFAGLVRDRARVVANVVDSERVRRLAAERDVERRDVVFLGRLTEVKRPQTVIRAVAGARRAVPELTARLVGDGDLRAACEREIRALGLDGGVRLEGFQSNPYPFVRAARIALMPSTYEGLGLAAIEALALGVPVLNSGAGGLGDMFAAHPEFICRTVEEYAARLVELQDPDRYCELQAACAEIVAPYCDLARYTAQIRELYA
ncbi:glycosyltransferase [Xylanimonas ulmi]|uniref:D-inositol 3-phosphate glycosyltransferase n=1 Tax=Xylanimonas ulmi TaxID=228973 RepID=A0A4Q7LZ01_9MICO|nr:glycosyltransferase [Xylanibacterium ulmi]RZS59961.1 glycosyltransferase involved in cell wall biosynthesis [Xylanibacterium ulmi]